MRFKAIGKLCLSVSLSGLNSSYLFGFQFSALIAMAFDKGIKFQIDCLRWQFLFVKELCRCLFNGW